MVNEQVLEGHWTEVAGQVKERWGQVTDNELAQVRGSAQQLVGLIQRKTGESRERIEHELEDLIAEGSSIATRTAVAARESADQAAVRMQQEYEQAAQRLREGYRDAERVVQQRPVESVAVAFGSGLIAGVIVGLVLRAR